MYTKYFHQICCTFFLYYARKLNWGYRICPFFIVWLIFLFSISNNNYHVIFVDARLKILPYDKEIDGIAIDIPHIFIKNKVQAKGIYLNVDFENLDLVKATINKYQNEDNLYCNLNKGKKAEGIEKEEKQEYNDEKADVVITNDCLVFVNIKYKDSLINVQAFMEYMYLKTSAIGLIFVCDNFLYENEIYKPHGELNITILGINILTYLISYDLLSEYDKRNFNKYTFELYWGIENKTDIVHIVYNLDFGKYFSYSFFIYMKNFLLELKNYITYEIKFSVHTNFIIDPRFCFIRDSSYCISEPDYINSNMVREVVEQQVRSLCIYKLTSWKNEKLQQIPVADNNNVDKTFSEKFIHYINALFDLGFEKKICSSGSIDLTKKCSDKILSHINVSVKEVNDCFLKNFHTYMKNMIKSKFYVYTIVINNNVFKIKLNKDMSIRLICSAFKSMPPRCLKYLKGDKSISFLEMKRKKKEQFISLYFLIVVVLVHIMGTLLNYVVPRYIDAKEKKTK
ncbi:conserved Plasmodium protein, unknown function [Plasmodium chabaudi chabaudi]|uniref:Uncharacterized protein n=1 Tax=Plasmodium chabaudi chabaudi TaxID=31271 RepID=A0A1C6YUI1_PLACU|nr:conserved Plasmodium protein, unknown function [Plasmodium chabaudi chabaudi]